MRGRRGLPRLTSPAAAVLSAAYHVDHVSPFYLREACYRDTEPTLAAGTAGGVPAAALDVLTSPAYIIGRIRDSLARTSGAS